MELENPTIEPHTLRSFSVLNSSCFDDICLSEPCIILQGAKVLLGGKRHSLGGTFYEPTVLGDASDRMLIFRYQITFQAVHVAVGCKI